MDINLVMIHITAKIDEKNIYYDENSNDMGCIRFAFQTPFGAFCGGVIDFTSLSSLNEIVDGLINKSAKVTDDDEIISEFIEFDEGDGHQSSSIILYKNRIKFLTETQVGDIYFVVDIVDQKHRLSLANDFKVIYNEINKMRKKKRV